MIKSVAARDAFDWEVIDTTTGMPLSAVTWANDATGEYYQYPDPGARYMAPPVKKIGNIRLVHRKKSRWPELKTAL